MNKLSVLRQLKFSSNRLVGSSHYLEVKGAASRVDGIRSRGQVATLDDGTVTILAKCGHRPPRPGSGTDAEIKTAEGQWLLDHVNNAQQEDALIETYQTQTLPSFAKIIAPGGPDDMVMVQQEKKVNVDYDWKRKIQSAGEASGVSPVTVPHQTVTEVVQHRRAMKRIRGRGECATPEKVEAELSTKGKRTRRLYNDAGTIVRLVLRGLLQGKFEDQELCLSYGEMARRVTSVWRSHQYDLETKKKVWTRDNVKNETRGLFEPGIVMPTTKNNRLLDDLCQGLELDGAVVRDVVFSRDAFDEVLDRVVEQVVLAVLHAPRMGLEPFTSLWKEGGLPDRTELVNVLYPRVTDMSVMALARGSFVPGCLPDKDQGQLAKIFTWFSIPKAQAHAAAKVIAPTKYREVNPQSSVSPRLLDLFVLAALDQTLMAPASVPDSATLLTKLRFFGLTAQRLNRLRNVRFVPHSLVSTPTGRRDIKRLAQAIGLSAQPFIDAVLGEKS